MWETGIKPNLRLITEKKIQRISSIPHKRVLINDKKKRCEKLIYNKVDLANLTFNIEINFSYKISIKKQKIHFINSQNNYFRNVRIVPLN